MFMFYDIYDFPKHSNMLTCKTKILAIQDHDKLKLIENGRHNELHFHFHHWLII